MLVYEDTKLEVKPEVKPDETKPSTSVSKKENKTAKKVNTGVKNSTAFFTGLMGVSVAALGVVEVLKRRSK